MKKYIDMSDFSKEDIKHLSPEQLAEKHTKEYPETPIKATEQGTPYVYEKDTSIRCREDEL